MTLRRKKRCSAVLESLSMVWRRRWTSGCPSSFSTTCVSELAEPFTFLWGVWGDGQGEAERGGAGAINFTALLLLLLSDIPPRGSDHKREMYVSKDTQFKVSNQTNLSLKVCVLGHKSGRASFFFFFHMRSSPTFNQTPGKTRGWFTANKSIQSTECSHFHCVPKFVLARIYYLNFLFATVSTRQSTVPTRPLCTGLREAPRERKGLSLQDWGGTGRKAVRGGGMQALQ